MSVTSFERLFRSTLDSVLEKKLEEGIEINEQQLKVVLNNVFASDFFDEITEVIFLTLKQSMYEMLEQERLVNMGFTSRLKQRWLSPISKLDALIMISEEICTDSIDTTKEIQREDDGTANTSLKYFVIMKLLSKIIVTSKEVSYLLKGGFADAAISRWRTIHEINTTVQILSELYEDKDKINKLLLRYNDSIVIEQFKEMKKTLHLDKKSIEYIELKKETDSILRKYGSDFYRSYEWARPLFPDYNPKKSITFKILEKLAQNQYLEHYYQQANYQIHASPSGVFNSLGEIGDDRVSYPVYIFGPSNYGLSIPGQLTTISILNAISAFLLTTADIDHVIQVKILQRFSDEILEEFNQIQQDIVSEELEFYFDQE